MPRKSTVTKTSPLTDIPPIVQQVLRMYYNRPHDYATVTVTGLNQTPRSLALGQLGFERMKLPQRIADGVLALLGTCLHEWMERRVRERAFEAEKTDNSPRYLIEHRMVVPIPQMPEGMTANLGGTFDLYDLEAKTLYDYKVMNCFKLGHAAPDYSLQMNTYRLLLQHLGFPTPERLRLLEFGRDWSDPGKGGKSGCAFPLVAEDIPIDPAIDLSRVMQLARERAIAVLRFRSAVEQERLFKATDGAQGTPGALAAWLAATPPCEGEYIKQWGVLPGGVPRRCMYCTARNVCERVGGKL